MFQFIQFILFSTTILGIASAQPQTAPDQPNHLLLSGNLVTPDGVIAHGWLDIVKGRILHVETQRPDELAKLPGTQILETNDLIFPGFIDLHNHPTFNVFPRWTPPHKFSNRYAWRDWHVYQQQLESKGYALAGDPTAFCDIDEYVEVKALIGGTTSIIGLGSNDPAHSSPDCLRGLVRNLDHYTGFYGPGLDHERIANSIGILPRDMNAQTAATRARQIENGTLDLLAIHIAEGLPTDPESAQELDLLEARGLLTRHTALIHAVGLSPSQLARVHRAGSSIVWSPRSNFELYGATANVDAAFREGVTISLAPDWSPSGSDNMWEEIQYARQVSDRDLGGLFSNRQLVEMASFVPARVAFIDDKVGALAPGMFADLFLVHMPNESPGSLKSPYDTIVAQDITAVDLVMIDGVVLYGKPELLKSLHLETEPLTICGTEKALNSAALPSGSFAQVEKRLRERMKSMDSELGPFDSCSRH
jgi:cytosine/adenosine deaminase-related metal-dependent hydrolase